MQRSPPTEVTPRANKSLRAYHASRRYVAQKTRMPAHRIKSLEHSFKGKLREMLLEAFGLQPTARFADVMSHLEEAAASQPTNHNTP